MDNHIHDRWSPEKANGTTKYLRSDVKWLYHTSFYDGPISGMCRVNGEELWFQIFEECNITDADNNPVCGFYRRYLLYRLTPESSAEEQRRHAIFEEYVGTHCTYDSEGKRNLSGLKPEWMWKEFYDQQKTWPLWEPEGEVAGWFER